MAEEKDKAATGPALKVTWVKEISLPAAVLALALAPDARTAHAACLDGAIQSVDLEAGKATELSRHESYASGVALLAGGQTLVSAGYDGMLHWHDLTGRKVIRKVKAHDFWSWDMDASSDGSMIASCTGQYQCGGYKYEPAPEREPSIKVFDARTGELRHSFSHVPPVQAVKFTPDGRHVAASNLMGETRVWELATGKQVAQFATPSFTGWGIIKGHYYTGGIQALMFTADGNDLYVCGMGSTTDPAAGNGRQLWQRFNWREGKKLSETRESDNGHGDMVSLGWHPGRNYFAMGGRLFQGKWNLAFFNAGDGTLLHSLDVKHRVTEIRFTPDGNRLVLGKAKFQEKPKDGKWPNFGLVQIYSVAAA
ncbi:MAG TPA: hypothetical protein VHH73_08055 [Verrucomicrobiae bacterium]|nr:hypothetical protein [Verrucomicrobiae bacterium]